MNTDKILKESAKKKSKDWIIISCFGVLFIGGLIYSFEQLPNPPFPLGNAHDQGKGVITNVSTTPTSNVSFLDKMSCSQVKNWIDNTDMTFTNDYQADSIKAHASELWNDCLGKLSQKYNSIYETNKGWFGRMINGTDVPLEYHP